MFQNELAYKVILVEEIMSGLFHGRGFKKSVTVPKNSGIDNEREKTALNVRLGKLFSDKDRAQCR